MSEEYIRKADAVDRMKRYGSIWMEYTEGMSNHEVAEQALKASKQAVIDVLENLPSADVAPVVHGRWVKEDRGHVEYCAVCDQCGFDWMWSDRGYFKFCPNCGAKMRGEQE